MPRMFIAASLLAGGLFAVTLTPTLALFQRACQNCHSENTQWPWYSRIPPASWKIRKDVDDARRHVNFSNWDSYGPKEQEEFLTRILTPQERQKIYEWSRAEKKRLRAERHTHMG